MTARADTLSSRIIAAAPWIIIAIAIIFRIYALDRLPGLNGDEAWYGVQAQRWAGGEALRWRTPSGNLPGPVQIGWMLVLQPIFTPSVTLLRIPPLISSLAAMGLAYAIGRRFFDRTTAMIALLLMAALPANIVYARFGWDPSHIGLVILASCWAALAGRPLLSALAFALALIVHPTSVFAAPFLTFAFLGADLERHGRRQALKRSGVHVALLAAALALLAITTSQGQVGIGMAGLKDRLTQPLEWAIFPLLFERLLSGETVYSFVTGHGLGVARHAADVFGAALLALLVTVGTAGLWGKRFGLIAGIVTGWVASLLAFFLIAGNEALQPHHERYALVLIVPTVLALGLLIRRLFPEPGREGRAILFTLAITASLLVGFWLRYFVVLEREGSVSATAFWTGLREPKQVAVECILAATTVSGPAQVIAEDWWLYQPLAYLAHGKGIDLVDPGRRGPPLAMTRLPGGTYLLVFGGSEMDSRIAATHHARLRWTIPATGHPRAINIWWTPTIH